MSLRGSKPLSMSGKSSVISGNVVSKESREPEGIGSIIRRLSGDRLLCVTKLQYLVGQIHGEWL